MDPGLDERRCQRRAGNVVAADLSRHSAHSLILMLRATPFPSTMHAARNGAQTAVGVRVPDTASMGAELGGSLGSVLRPGG